MATYLSSSKQQRFEIIESYLKKAISERIAYRIESNIALNLLDDSVLQLLDEKWAEIPEIGSMAFEPIVAYTLHCFLELQDELKSIALLMSIHMKVKGRKILMQVSLLDHPSVPGFEYEFPAGMYNLCNQERDEKNLNTLDAFFKNVKAVQSQVPESSEVKSSIAATTSNNSSDSEFSKRKNPTDSPCSDSHKKVKVESVPKNTLKCPGCEHKYEIDYKFCGYCGKKLKAGAPRLKNL